MKKNHSIQITDPIRAKLFRSNYLNTFFLKYLNDKRDIPFIKLCAILSVTTIPAAVVMYVPGIFSWWLAGIYFSLNSLIFLGPYILMLHNVSHRALFKNEYGFLNKIIPWIYGPFFGLSPETYFVHHIGMHHAENNMEADLSTTLHSRGDSIKDFMKYFFKFLIWCDSDLYGYLKDRNRKKLMRKFVLGEVAFAVISIALLLVNWRATLVVFIIPLFFVRFMMMAGNWAQHAFIDVTDPANNYKNSITCINSGYNKRCFNDGYHIAHHIHPTMHWTEMPQEFLKNIEDYRKEEAVVFRQLDYFAIWVLLMFKDYNRLAKYFVELNPDSPKSKEEIITLLKNRTKRI
jgi:fatty acid desaturase